MKIVIPVIVLLAISHILVAQDTFPTTGNVGIGTATPAYNLDISSGANTTLKIGSTATTVLSDLVFKGSLSSWKISKSASGSPGTGGSLDITYNTNIYGGDRPVLRLAHTVSDWTAQF